MTEHKESTQAQRWLFAVRVRTANITTSNQKADAIRAVLQLNADFPNQEFKLVKDGVVIGTRRVFGDRSYADLLDEHAAIGKVIFGVLTDGELGTAGNGRTIH